MARSSRPGPASFVLALLAVAMLCAATVRSAGMAAEPSAMASMPFCDMPGMRHDRPNDRHSAPTHNAECPVCAVAAMLPLPATGPVPRPLRAFRPVAFVRTGGPGARGPPAISPVARGPPGFPFRT